MRPALNDAVPATSCASAGAATHAVSAVTMRSFLVILSLLEEWGGGTALTVTTSPARSWSRCVRHKWSKRPSHRLEARRGLLVRIPHSVLGSAPGALASLLRPVELREESGPENTRG